MCVLMQRLIGCAHHRCCGRTSWANRPRRNDNIADEPGRIPVPDGHSGVTADGTEDKEITIKFPSGAERKFTGQVLLLNFCLPNFYFHYTTSYDILRNCGVEVGKRDFMGTPVTL